MQSVKPQELGSPQSIKSIHSVKPPKFNNTFILDSNNLVQKQNILEEDEDELIFCTYCGMLNQKTLRHSKNCPI